MADRGSDTSLTTRATKPQAATPPAAAGGAAGEASAPAANAEKKPAMSSSFKAWLPMIATVASMPVLACVTTRYLILPKVEQAMTHATASADTPAAAPAAESTSKGVEPGKNKITVPMSKILVNVAGTMGTRYLMTSVTLVGTATNFNEKIDENKDQLMDLATSTLSSKTISDLEKPGARNVIRAELITVFNNALGGPLVQEVYITEMAIQ